MKKPSGIYESTPDKSGSIQRPALGNISIEQLLTAFNSEKTKYLASKVVDANGEPLVAYHGTASDFNKYSRKQKAANRRIYLFAAYRDDFYHLSDRLFYFRWQVNK